LSDDFDVRSDGQDDDAESDEGSSGSGSVSGARLRSRVVKFEDLGSLSKDDLDLVIALVPTNSLLQLRHEQIIQVRCLCACFLCAVLVHAQTDRAFFCCQSNSAKPPKEVLKLGGHHLLLSKGGVAIYLIPTDLAECIALKALLCKLFFLLGGLGFQPSCNESHGLAKVGRIVPIAVIVRVLLEAGVDKVVIIVSGQRKDMDEGMAMPDHIDWEDTLLAAERADWVTYINPQPPFFSPPPRPPPPPFFNNCEISPANIEIGAKLRQFFKNHFSSRSDTSFNNCKISPTTCDISPNQSRDFF
jgi:hypothetical protein